MFLFELRNPPSPVLDTRAPGSQTFRLGPIIPPTFLILHLADNRSRDFLNLIMHEPTPIIYNKNIYMCVYREREKKRNTDI